MLLYKMKLIKITSLSFLFIFVILFSNTAFAQGLGENNFNDTTLGQLASINLHDHYLNFIQRQSELYSGREYIGFKEAAKGHQFLHSDLWQSANIVFDGFLYKDIDTRFDIYEQLVLIKHFDENGRMVSIVPDQKKIKSFTIYDKFYLNMDFLDTVKNSSKVGFLQVIYNGDIKVLAKREKNTVNSSLSNLYKEFREKERYFILKDNELYKISSKRAFLKVVPEYKKPLKKFARKRRMFFSDNKARFLKDMIEQYEFLKDNE